MGKGKRLMKKNNSIKFLVIIIIGFLPLYFFPEELSDWHFNKIIDITGNNKYKYFFLDKEVYQYANQDLSDLRLLDDSENFIPYYIKDGFQDESEEVLKYQSKEIFRSKNEKENFSIYDFQALSNKKDMEVNILFIDTNMGSYSKQVEIYGRNDNTDWILLTKDTIYKINDFIKNEISLGKTGKNNFYRIKVLDNTENLVITRCSLIYSKIIKEAQQYIKDIDLKFEIESKERYSIINIKNMYNLKLVKFMLEINGNFKRGYDLYDGTSDYILKRGYIYNFKSDNINITNTEIDLDYRYLNKNENLLTIINNDDQPLKINNIRGSYLVDRIVFEDTGSKSYYLYFGNDKSIKPVYDIESYKNYIDKEDQDLCSLDRINKIKPLLLKGKKAFNYKILFNIIIVIVSISLIVILVIKLSKK